MKYSVTCYCDISYGHRIVNGGKCEHLHGHNGRVTFTCSTDKLDVNGMVVNFSEMKAALCEWVKQKFDHKFLIWEKDPIASGLYVLDKDGVVILPFTPTAENMARFIITQLQETMPQGVILESVTFRETERCSAVANFAPFNSLN